LLAIPRGNSSQAIAQKPIYHELIEPEAKKIVWYALPKKLPEVSAEQRIGTFPKPRAANKSEVTMIATAPQPQSSKQFIWQVVPKLQIHQDLPSPNLIARAAMSIPAPPPPPEPRPKIDQPDTQGKKAPQPNISPPNPNGNVNKAQQALEHPIEVPKPRKTFVPPKPSDRPSRAVIPVQTADVPVPSASITGLAPARTTLPDGIGEASISKGAPPPPKGPPGPANANGNGSVDIAVVGLHPEKGPVPDGSRPGQFSQAPLVGELSTGEVKGGIGIPNLTIHDDRKPVPPPEVEPPRRIVLYADRLRSLPVSTLSVPLRAASGSVPARLESVFQGRDVYTMVIPIENIAGYSGDWIIWFAERGQTTGAALNVRAPVPLRKYESVDPVPAGSPLDIRVQIQAVINREGKLDRILLLRDLAPGLESAVLRDVKSWEFKPATRDGKPIDIDVVLEIPFSLPPQFARSQP
jgi:hypothetical protein